jgi:hypothetical protein
MRGHASTGGSLSLRNTVDSLGVFLRPSTLRPGLKRFQQFAAAAHGSRRDARREPVQRAWAAVRQRIDGIRTGLDRASGHVSTGRTGRPRRRDIESPYLLSGFARCADCGGSLGVLDRRQYGCIAHHKRGTTVCGNGVRLPLAMLDDAVLRELRDKLKPKAIMPLIDLVFGNCHRQPAPAI